MAQIHLSQPQTYPAQNSLHSSHTNMLSMLNSTGSLHERSYHLSLGWYSTSLKFWCARIGPLKDEYKPLEDPQDHLGLDFVVG